MFFFNCFFNFYSSNALNDTPIRARGTVNLARSLTRAIDRSDQIRQDEDEERATPELLYFLLGTRRLGLISIIHITIWDK